MGFVGLAHSTLPRGDVVDGRFLAVSGIDGRFLAGNRLASRSSWA
ncbi:hypothetical protein [Sinosporangium siamense]|nr:hypothetical protein [Sinosporangium siamense]